ncbi:hypothetical protein AB0M05_27720 [Streptomyces violaceusniger]|uniref:hypothetical protein n=1 Tax=Streptomyces violaceusniger TaxID=68280 RepID=UPI0034131F4E
MKATGFTSRFASDKLPRLAARGLCHLVEAASACLAVASKGFEGTKGPNRILMASLVLSRGLMSEV